MTMDNAGGHDAAGVISSHFRAQHLRPAHLVDLRVDRLSPYFRALLISEGTTRLIEAHVLEAARALPTTQYATTRVGDSDRALIDAEPGTPVVMRAVDIVGARTGRRFATAESVLVPERLPDSLARAIDDEAAGIGGAINAAQVENHRELLWYGMETDGVPVRTYRIVIDGCPAILITEWFLVSPWLPSPAFDGNRNGGGAAMVGRNGYAAGAATGRRSST